MYIHLTLEQQHRGSCNWWWSSWSSFGSIWKGFNMWLFHLCHSQYLTIISFYQAGLTAKDRPILTHCQILGADLLAKMAANGVIANVQPQFVTTDSLWVEKRVQPNVIPYCYAWKTMLQQGKYANIEQKHGDVLSSLPISPTHAAQAFTWLEDLMRLSNCLIHSLVLAIEFLSSSFSFLIFFLYI